MDLCEPTPNTMAAFCVKIADRAASDHARGVKRRPSGKILCSEYSEGYRGFHVKLASSVYNYTRRSYEVADKEKREALPSVPPGFVQRGYQPAGLASEMPKEESAA